MTGACALGMPRRERRPGSRLTTGSQALAQVRGAGHSPRTRFGQVHPLLAVDHDVSISDRRVEFDPEQAKAVALDHVALELVDTNSVRQLFGLAVKPVCARGREFNDSWLNLRDGKRLNSIVRARSRACRQRAREQRQRTTNRRSEPAGWRHVRQSRVCSQPRDGDTRTAAPRPAVP